MVKEFYNDGFVTVYHGNVIEILSSMPEGSVRCCVTPPPSPYYGLWKYAGEQELVWGNGHCDHECGLRL